MMDRVAKIITQIKEESGGEVTQPITSETDLRKDLSFSSLDLATLTAEIEDEFGVDVFEDGFVYTVGDILEKVSK